MPKSALDNPLVLPILGLLTERPRHPYAVYAELRRRYPHLRARNATVYTLLETLRELGWVEAGPDEDHAALRVTGAGSAALAERVEGELRGGDLTGGPSYLAALAYLSIMSPARAALVLHARAAAVADESRRLESVLAGAGASEVHMIEVHYLLTRLNHDRQWLTATARRVEAGDLAWP
ncbi:MAG TPA: PadR family transcriptional regulator [Trebonia sp.]